MITGFVVGFIIGFLFSMPPLGPTYFAIIERGLEKQFKNAVAIGVGAGFMDMIYILIAYGGVSLLVSLLPDNVNVFFLNNEYLLKTLLAFAGCLVVILYGIKILKSKSTPIEVSEVAPEKFDEKFKNKFTRVESVFKKTEVGMDRIFHTKKFEESHSEVVKSFLVGIVMCLSSVTLPASWFAAVGYLKSYGIINSNFFTGFFLGIGVLAGTSVWFYLMTKLIFRYSEKLKPSVLKKLNYFTGILLIALGLGFIIKLVSVYF
ncbi:MAG TPA: LysE family transporter [Ignavibacteria bacterium]|nr:LysE family transporter [Ignavibacteria bacterium]HMR39703.1 LysE family transporter [Ignavibacteria bacterium]